MAGINLTPDQVATLKRNGFTDTQISQYQNGFGGGLPVAIQSRMSSALTPALGGSQSRQYNDYATQPQFNFQTSPKYAGLYGGKPAASQGVTYGSGAYLGQNPQPTPSAPRIQQGSYGSSGSRTPSTASYVDPDPTHNSFGGAYGTKEGAPGGPPIATADPGGAYPTYPDMGSYTVPTITPKDFTAEAMSLATKAFAPVQTMLDQSKTNVGAEGERSRQVVGGLYDNLVKDIATSAAAQSQQYDAQKQTTQDTGTALATQIGQNYSSGNAATADLLAKIGGQAAAPQVLQQGANDQAWQQSQANQGTAQQVDYFGKQQQGQSDYNAQLGNIQRNEGVNAQSGILNQVRQMLAGIDQQKAQTTTDTSNTGLDIANKLSAQDLSAQQANAGYAQTGQQNAQAAALSQYQAGVDKYNTANSNARNQAADTAAANQQIFDNNIAQGTLNNNSAKAGTTVASKVGNSLPESRNVYATADPANGGAAFDSMFQLAQDPAFIKSGTGSAGLSNYLQAARAWAIKAGLDENTTALMAADIYRQLYGTG